MSSVQVSPAGRWCRGVVAELSHPHPMAVIIKLDVQHRMEHLPGQHYVVRLTADDGYSASRSYSVASAPHEPLIELYVERLDDGEVSPYLTGELRVGDTFELRGPIGGYFVWETADGGPLLLIAGGSGLVPLMAMLRHRAARRSAIDARLLLSTRSRAEVLYERELDRLAADPAVAVHQTFTREAPAGWRGFARRVDLAMLSQIGPGPQQRPRIFVCGPTAFVERAAGLLVELGHDPAAVRAERFGG
jgi:ferredoxin-NADP reductase